MIKKIILICSVILFLSNNLLAKEKYTFFGIEMGKPLKNEKILTGELDWAMEIFEPIKKNKTFDKYLLQRGRITKSVYKIQITGPMENSDKCIFNKTEFWDKFFIKNYPFIKKDIIVNTTGQYGHKLTFDKSLEIVTKCIFYDDFKKIYIEISYQQQKQLNEDDEFFKQKRKEELDKNDTTGFEVN